LTYLYIWGVGILILFLALVPALHGGDRRAEEFCAKARAEVKLGRWRTAGAHYREAISACAGCSVEEVTILRAELANVLVHGGFPEAGAAVWRQAIEGAGDSAALRAMAESGLGVALFAAGRSADAERVWRRACQALDGYEVEQASCRFNLAVARMDSAPVWSELEVLLPVLMRVEGAITRVTALLQTARAAQRAGESGRARTLAEQADAIVRAEMFAEHPVMGSVYAVRAEIAEARGLYKEAREWRKKAARPRGEGWKKESVSVEELKWQERE